MKGRVILLDMPEERPSQAALLVDGRLEDLLLDAPKGDATPEPGAISWARVERLAPKLGGAFLRLSLEAEGFLRDAKGLRAGEGILVQVSGYAEPGKAVPVTTRILYKSRRLIHTPDAPGINVSRQIRDAEERARLTELVEAAVTEGTAPKGGFIIRSVAREAEADDLASDLANVIGQRAHHEGLRRSAEPGQSASPVLAIDLALREWTDPLPDAVHVGPRAERHVLAPDVIARYGADLAQLMRCHDGPDPFADFGVWEEIDRLLQPPVDLDDGTWMSVEPTRAMVTVDVNTAGDFSPAAALKANLAAARELPRQLRLRGLGGVVTIDFAPLARRDRKKVENAVSAALRRDAVATSLAGWTPLGHLQLQRKRERRPLTELLP
ncbi:MAG: ribonuclease E/G [Pseudomonadota bacterium]